MGKAHKSLDGYKRKRFYLFRHGEVDYTPQGKVVKNPDLVDLTEVGKKQAKSIDENTKEFSIERIICSGLPRTLQTAEHIASRREITIECFPLLKEYEWDPDLLKDTKLIFINMWIQYVGFTLGSIEGYKDPEQEKSKANWREMMKRNMETVHYSGSLEAFKKFISSKGLD